MITAEIHDLKAYFPDKPEIKKMKPSAVRELYKRIQPVVRDEDGDLAYMKPCNPHNDSFLWERDETMTNKATGIMEIGTIATLHAYGYYGMFKPSVEEVLAQLPEALLPRVVAFETIGPDDSTDLSKQRHVVDAGFHVAKTILYGLAPTDNFSKEKKPVPATKPIEDKPHPSIIAYPIPRKHEDRHDAERIAKTFYTVRATHEEQHQIWARHAHQSEWTDLSWGRVTLHWLQDSMGMSEQIGEVAKMPVMLTGFWQIIEGHHVFFWEMTSMVTHYGMGENWIRKVFKKAKGHTNSTNFHHVIGALSDATGKKFEAVKP